MGGYFDMCACGHELLVELPDILGAVRPWAFGMFLRVLGEIEFAKSSRDTIENVNSSVTHSAIRN